MWWLYIIPCAIIALLIAINDNVLLGIVYGVAALVNSFCICALAIFTAAAAIVGFFGILFMVGFVVLNFYVLISYYKNNPVLYFMLVYGFILICIFSPLIGD